MEEEKEASNGNERRVQPDPDSKGKVFEFEVPVTETAPPSIIYKFRRVQPDPESQGERLVQPDPESQAKVFDFDVSLTTTAPTQRKPIIWPSYGSYARWMLIDRRAGSVDPRAAAEKLWRKRAKRLRLAQLQSGNKEDPVNPPEDTYFVT
ncbi:uncharacterized protein LOC141692495 isoform X1 [Apium graveolens]|uniref:uncharacterized protein LOC141692495 isoform X1 n=1 Tax=Apium graveolens TaxID=4045 RepID=UPI003D79F425